MGPGTSERAASEPSFSRGKEDRQAAVPDRELEVRQSSIKPLGQSVLVSSPLPTGFLPPWRVSEGG